MKPERCVTGAVVFYWSASGGRAYVGNVACEPWPLRDGTLVTKLKNMDADYQADFGKSVVHGASVEMLAEYVGAKV